MQSHPNVVQYRGITELKNGDLAVVMEYCSKVRLMLIFFWDLFLNSFFSYTFIGITCWRSLWFKATWFEWNAIVENCFRISVWFGSFARSRHHSSRYCCSQRFVAHERTRSKTRWFWNGSRNERRLSIRTRNKINCWTTSMDGKLFFEKKINFKLLIIFIYNLYILFFLKKNLFLFVCCFFSKKRLLNNWKVKNIPNVPMSFHSACFCSRSLLEASLGQTRTMLAQWPPLWLASVCNRRKARQSKFNNWCSTVGRTSRASVRKQAKFATRWASWSTIWAASIRVDHFIYCIVFVEKKSKKNKNKDKLEI